MSRRLIPSLLIAAALGAGVALPLVTSRTYAAPEPSRVPVSWELNFRYGPIERILVTVDGKSAPYWFVRYTVTNNSGRDVLFTPNFELVSENGEALQAFKEKDGKTSIPNVVFEKIKALYKNSLLQSPTEIYGKLLQGEDNAKDGVMIFPAIDPDARNFRLFVSGLSGETAEVKNPMDGKSVILQKTLEVDLNLPGQAIGIDPASKVTATKWVMK